MCGTRDYKFIGMDGCDFDRFWEGKGNVVVLLVVELVM